MRRRASVLRCPRSEAAGLESRVSRLAIPRTRLPPPVASLIRPSPSSTFRLSVTTTFNTSDCDLSSTCLIPPRAIRFASDCFAPQCIIISDGRLLACSPCQKCFIRRYIRSWVCSRKGDTKTWAAFVIYPHPLFSFLSLCCYYHFGNIGIDFVSPRSSFCTHTQRLF